MTNGFLAFSTFIRKVKVMDVVCFGHFGTVSIEYNKKTQNNDFFLHILANFSKFKVIF